MTDELRPFGRPAVSDALLGEQRRLRNSRASIARALSGRRLRRRVVPPVAIGSMVLLGTAAAGIWVHGIVEPATTTLASAPAAADPSTAIQQATLDQLRRQIAADEATLAVLTGGKVPASVAQAAAAATLGGGQPSQPGQPTGGARQPAANAGKAATGAVGGSTVAAGKAVAAAAGGGQNQPAAGATAPAAQPVQPPANPAPQPQPTAAPAPAPAPKPAPTTAAPPPPPPPPPTVHATSGASGGHG